MKIFKLVLSFFVIVILFTGFIYAQLEPHVQIVFVSGKAEFRSRDTSEWKEAKAGIVLASGDSIRTYKNSSVDMAFDTQNKNIVGIKEDTHVVIKLSGEEKIELVDGEILALVKKLPSGSRFEIRTPTAVCGARGTGWGANGNKDSTIVSAYEKDSYAKGVDKEGNIMEDNLTVKEGYKTTVNRFQKPSRLAELSSDDYDKWNKWKDDLIERLTAQNTRRERLSRDLEKVQDKKEEIERRRDTDRIDKRTERTGAGTGTERNPPKYLE